MVPALQKSSYSFDYIMELPREWTIYFHLGNGYWSRYAGKIGVDIKCEGKREREKKKCEVIKIYHNSSLFHEHDLSRAIQKKKTIVI